ncbi:MAG: MFS transporter [Promethearchaeota archaeon]
MSEHSKKPEEEQLSPWQKKPEIFDARILFLISFGYFSATCSWALYNAYVSDALYSIIGVYSIVGILMTLDNIVAVFLTPISGSLSDRTKNRFGRRKPFILIGLPISAISFFFIPVFEKNITGLLITMFIFIVSMALWRSQITTLTADFCPPKFRSKGNGIIGLLGSIGPFFAYVIGGIFIDINPFIPFGIITALMFIGLAIVMFTVKEPDTRNWNFSYLEIEKEKKISLWESLKLVITEEEKSPLFMLVVVFLLIASHQAVVSLWTVYATESSIFDLTRGEATKCLSWVALSALIFVIPGGILAKKITRKKTIIIGFIICAISVFICNFIKGAENLTVIIVLFFIYGIGYVFVLVNMIVIIWELAPSAKHIGTYTGLYFLSFYLASIFGPIIVGFFMDIPIIGKENMFVICSGFLTIAIFLMLKVKRGEVTVLTEEERKTREKAIQEINIG